MVVAGGIELLVDQDCPVFQVGDQDVVSGDDQFDHASGVFASGVDGVASAVDAVLADAASLVDAVDAGGHARCCLVVVFGVLGCVWGCGLGLSA